MASSLAFACREKAYVNLKEPNWLTSCFISSRLLVLLLLCIGYPPCLVQELFAGRGVKVYMVERDSPYLDIHIKYNLSYELPR
jgi:hypothetical protein